MTPLPCRHCAGPKPTTPKRNRVYCSESCAAKAKEQRRLARERGIGNWANQWTDRPHMCPKCSTIGILVAVLRDGRRRWLCESCSATKPVRDCSHCEGMPWRRARPRCGGCKLPYEEEPERPVVAFMGGRESNFARGMG